MQFLLKTCEQCHKVMNGGVYRSSYICPFCGHEHESPKNKSARPSDTLTAATAQDSTVFAPIDSTPATPEVKAASVGEEPSACEEPSAHQEPSAYEQPSASYEEPSASYDEPSAHEESTPVEDQTVFQPKPQAEAQPEASIADVSLTTKAADEQDFAANLGEVSAESVTTIDLTPDMFVDGKFVGTKSAKVQSTLKQGKKDALAKLRAAGLVQGANLVAAVTVKNAMKMAGSDQANITVSATGVALVVEEAEAF